MVRMGVSVPILVGGWWLLNIGTVQAQTSVETCEDLVEAAQAASSEDTVVLLDPDLDLECDTYTTVRIENNRLTVSLDFDGQGTVSTNNIDNVRFEVAAGGSLVWENDVIFAGNESATLEVNGGFLNVEAGSTARFMGGITVEDYKLRSETEDGSDFSDDQWNGGCVFNQGYFQVDGLSQFLRCDITGGGESSPGPGGAVYNGDTGSILFNDGVDIQETSLTDDEGNSGAGIYNNGTINIRGDSNFEALVADRSEARGGAIYNSDGGNITFGGNARANFLDCGAATGGAIVNLGEITFDGPILVAFNSDEAIFNAGTMTISEDSVFWENEGIDVGAIYNDVGATLNIPDNVVFVGNVGNRYDDDDQEFCDNIYIREQAATFNDDGTVDVPEEFTCLP